MTPESNSPCLCSSLSKLLDPKQKLPHLEEYYRCRVRDLGLYRFAFMVSYRGTVISTGILEVGRGPKDFELDAIHVCEPPRTVDKSLLDKAMGALLAVWNDLRRIPSVDLFLSPDDFHLVVWVPS
jgi:hypothetical protein